MITSKLALQNSALIVFSRKNLNENWPYTELDYIKALCQSNGSIGQSTRIAGEQTKGWFPGGWLKRGCVNYTAVVKDIADRQHLTSADNWGPALVAS